MEASKKEAQRCCCAVGVELVSFSQLLMFWLKSIYFYGLVVNYSIAVMAKGQGSDISHWS